MTAFEMIFTFIFNVYYYQQPLTDKTHNKKVWSYSFIRREALDCPASNKQHSTPV